MVNFPASLDSLPNPSADDDLDNASPDLAHATQHSNANDAIEALEAKVGIDNSEVTSSLDYKLKNGGAIRKTAAVVTASLNPGAVDGAKALDLGKGCHVIRIATDYPAWVRIYSTATARTADSERAQTADPEGEHGVLLEVITTGSNLSLDLAPAALCYSLEDSPGTTIPISVTNLDSVARAITVTATLIPLEG